MEWRCTWCGKPHEEDDPPCDNCGHHEFERAVEPVPPEQDVDPSEPVWVCTECGREHQKHSPPCSRCGHVELEKQQPDYSDLEDLGGTSYLDVLEARYVVGYVAVALLGGVLLLGLLGVITLPGMGGPPEPPDAPGSGTSAWGNSLAATEDEYVALAGGDPGSEAARELRALAAYANKYAVLAAERGDATPSADELADRFSVRCEGTDALPSRSSYVVSADDLQTSDLDSPASLAEALYEGRPAAVDPSRASAVGVDVHVVQRERIYVTVATC